MFQLNLTKIVKTVATRCHILQLKCTKFDFGWGAYSSPNPLDGYKGSTSKGREGTYFYLLLRGGYLLLWRLGGEGGRNGEGKG